MGYVLSGHYEAVRLLLSRGVDVHALNHNRASPLHMAALHGHDQAVKVLLEHGSDVSCCIYFHINWPCCTGNSKYLVRIFIFSLYEVQQKTWWSGYLFVFSSIFLRSGIYIF